MNGYSLLFKQIAIRVGLLFVVLLSAACGSAKPSRPSDEPPSLSPDLGPYLSYYVAQDQVNGLNSTFAQALMGYSIAMGDFNGDGRLDVATGVPGREGGLVVVRQSSGRNDRINTSFGLSQLGLGSAGADDFGWSLAAGDFNGDGVDDLAIGAPHRDLDGNADAGEVFVVYGVANSGLSHRIITRVTQGQDGLIEPNDLLGWSLAAADFNCDGYADLAIGAPGERYVGKSNAGAVLIRWGSRTGLNRAYTPTLLTHPEPQAGSQFGYSLATGQFQSAWIYANGHSRYDLVVGSPFRDVTEYSVTQQGNLVYRDAGEVMFFWGNPVEQGANVGKAGLTSGTRLTDYYTDEPWFGWSMATGHFYGGGLDQLAVGAPRDLAGYVAIVDPLHNNVLERLFQSSDGQAYDVRGRPIGVVGIAENGDEYGYALAAGDFNDDGADDLAVGAPYEDLHGDDDVGLVYIRFGSTQNWLTNGVDAYYLSEGTAGSRLEPGDRFGMALAAGDLNGDGKADLAIGAPYEMTLYNGWNIWNAGALFVAASSEPPIGLFEGTWTGTIYGDRDTESHATFGLTLKHRYSVVSGNVQIQRPGVVIHVCEISINTGAQSMWGSGTTSASNPRHLHVTGSVNVDGYDIHYTLDLTVLANGTTMTAELHVTYDNWPCSLDHTFWITLTKQ